MRGTLRRGQCRHRCIGTHGYYRPRYAHDARTPVARDQGSILGLPRPDE